MMLTPSIKMQFLEAWYSVHQEVLSWGLALGEGSLGLPGQICQQQRLCVCVRVRACVTTWYSLIPSPWKIWEVWGLRYTRYSLSLLAPPSGIINLLYKYILFLATNYSHKW